MSRPVVSLKTSVSAFDRLHSQVDRSRGAMIKGRVPRDDLLKLLMDHSAMIEALRKCGHVAQDEPRVRKAKRVRI